MCNEAKKSKKFVMQVPKCGVEPAGWEVTFYNGGSGNQEGGKQGTVTKATAKTYSFAGGTNANWTTITEGSILDKPDRYCGFDASKVSANAEITVTFDYDVKKSSSASSDTGALAIVDGTGKVLASKSGLKLQNGSDSGKISAKIAKDGKAILYFSRGNAGGGGLDVTSITAKTAE